MLDKDTCSCFCPTDLAPAVCGPNYEFDDSCQCVSTCEIDASSCQNEETFFQDTCECRCSDTDLDGNQVCPEGISLNKFDCTCCSLSLTGCKNEQYFLEDRCECKCLKINPVTQLPTCGENEILNPDTCVCESNCIEIECAFGGVWNADLCKCECKNFKCPPF